MDWSIGEVARLSGVTSRTLRHYESIGLLMPSRTAANGYRHYDRASLVRLQRILLLREVGVGLRAIADALDGPTDDMRSAHRAPRMAPWRTAAPRIADRLGAGHPCLTAGKGDAHA